MNEEDKFGYYLSGLTDGEGSFVLSNRKVGNTKYPRCEFTISMRLDDYIILEEIQKYLKCGSIYIYKGKHKNAIANFVVFKPEDVFHKVIPVFEKYPLRAKKARDFKIWKQAAILCYEVRQRKQVGSKGNALQEGPGFKWKDSERDFYVSLIEKLRDIRKYNTSFEYLI